jgi:hypothetical protein
MNFALRVSADEIPLNLFDGIVGRVYLQPLFHHGELNC